MLIMLMPSGEGRDAFGALVRDFIDRRAQVIMTGGEQDGALTLPFLPELHPVLAPISTIHSF